MTQPVVDRRVLTPEAREDVAEGRWRADGPPIMFDFEGHLIRGHDRLTAEVEHGQPVEMAVAWGFTNPVAAHIRSRNP